MSEVLSFPGDLYPSATEWGLHHNTQTFTSPLSKSVQAREFPGARWQAKLTFGPLKQQQSAALRSFLARLRGASGRFYLHDHAKPEAVGAAIGAPIVMGVLQTGITLNTIGWSPSVPVILKAGDYFSVGPELKILTADAHSGADGAATLKFEPPLRNAPADGTPLVTSKPAAVFRLKDDRQARFRNRSDGLSSITIECVEVF